jgi:glucose/arabinose dehydrogenase
MKKVKYEANHGGSLLATSLVGQSLFRITLASDGRRVTSVERLFENQYGRLRQVLVGSDGAVYVATSNQDNEVAMATIVDHHDGRPKPGPFEGDDKVLRITPASP